MTIALVHWPVAVGTFDTHTRTTSYRLVWMCEADTVPGDFYSTHPPEITCPDCKVHAVKVVRYHAELFATVEERRQA